MDVNMVDLFVLGGNESLPLYHFNSLIANSQSEVYTFDRISASLLRLDRYGKVIGRSGGKGEGPNEFSLELSAVGVEICHDDLILAYDMNKPIVQKYDRELNHLGTQEVNGTIWWISCDESENILIHYRNSNVTQIIDKNENVISEFKLENISQNTFLLLKQFVLAEGLIYAAYLTKNELLILDWNGKIKFRVSFPAASIDPMKPATIQTYRLFFYNDEVHVLAAMDETTALHTFDLTGVYLRTIYFNDDLRNIYQNKVNYMYFLENNNFVLRKVLVDMKSNDEY